MQHQGESGVHAFNENEFYDNEKPQEEAKSAAGQPQGSSAEVSAQREQFLQQEMLQQQQPDRTEGVPGPNVISLQQPTHHVAGEFDRGGEGVKFAEKEPCWICMESTETPGTGKGILFRPCLCNSWVHQGCLRTWRYGSLNPVNAFRCPNCKTEYRFRKSEGRTQEQEQSFNIRYFLRCLGFFLGLLLFIIVCGTFWATISWGMDRNHKNIPIGMKYIGMSVVNGFPPANATDVWREEFKRPEVDTWHYYGAWGGFLFCIQVLIMFCFMGCSFDEEDENSRRHLGSCNCYCTHRPYDCYCYYADCHSPGRACCGDDCCKGSGGDCKCGGGGGNGGEVLLLIVLVIVIIAILIVVFSAIFVLIGYALKKIARLYDKYADRAKVKSEEELGLTEVVDRSEANYVAASSDALVAAGAGTAMV